MFAAPALLLWEKCETHDSIAYEVCSWYTRVATPLFSWRAKNCRQILTALKSRYAWSGSVPLVGLRSARICRSHVASSKLQREGKIRLLGVTNFDVLRLQEFVDADVKPETIQLQYSVLDHRPNYKMTDFCQEQGISLLCYGTVAGGFLSEAYLGMREPQPPFKNRSLTNINWSSMNLADGVLFQELLVVLNQFAKRHHASIATIASAYICIFLRLLALLSVPMIRSHLAENAMITQIELSQEDIHLIESVTDRSKGPKGGSVWSWTQ